MLTTLISVTGKAGSGKDTSWRDALGSTGSCARPLPTL